MSDINRDDDTLEVDSPPRFAFGERVAARVVVRNDGTYRGKDIGDVLVNRGDVGYVTRIDPFLQQFYIYAVDFVDTGHRVGMRAKELCTLDKLPADVLARLNQKLGDGLTDALRGLGRGDQQARPDAQALPVPLTPPALPAPQHERQQPEKPQALREPQAQREPQAPREPQTLQKPLALQVPQAPPQTPRERPQTPQEPLAQPALHASPARPEPGYPQGAQP